ncbi:MAG TPA: DUF6174 domain-containing protein [Longimicrobiaceae bacterium]
MWKHVLLIASAVAVLVVTTGCGLSATKNEDAARQELARHRSLWQSQKLQNYRYVGRRTCFCPREVVDPVVVEVRGDSVASATYQQTGEPAAARYAGLWPTLEGVFGIVEEALERDAASVQVEYDAERGYPRSITIDYVEGAVDDELRYTVEEFEPLP